MTNRQGKKAMYKPAAGMPVFPHHKGERTDLRREAMEVEEYLPDLSKKEKEDFKNRQVSGFCVWEAVKRRCNREWDKRSRVQLWIVTEEEIPGNP